MTDAVIAATARTPTDKARRGSLNRRQGREFAARAGGGLGVARLSEIA